MQKRDYKAQEKRIQAACDALLNGRVKSVRDAAKLFAVSRTTLSRRMSGQKSALERAEDFHRLRKGEETAMVKAIYTLERWGWPMSIKYLETMAVKILRARGDTQPLGDRWYQRFLDRHPDLRMKWSRNRDQVRSDAENIDAIRRWFSLFEQVVTDNGIAQEDMYNMDEKGFMKGIGEEVKVVIPRREEEAIPCQLGNREWVTVIEAISGAGELLPAFVIFEGKKVQDQWVNLKMDERMKIAVSEKGWTDSELGLEWLKHFEEHTRATVGKHRLLIMDGHRTWSKRRKWIGLF